MSRIGFTSPNSGQIDQTSDIQKQTSIGRSANGMSVAKHEPPETGDVIVKSNTQKSMINNHSTKQKSVSRPSTSTMKEHESKLDKFDNLFRALKDTIFEKLKACKDELKKFSLRITNDCINFFSKLNREGKISNN